MDNTTRLLATIEADMMRNIVRLLGRGSTTSASYRIDKLNEIGLLNSKNIAVIEKYKPQLDAALAEEIKKGGVSALAGINQAIPEQATGASPRVTGIWETWTAQSIDAMNKAQASLLRSAEQKYIDILGSSVARSLTGAATVREAIADTCRGWKGLDALVDRSGKVWSAEAYSQMVVRTNVRQVATDTQLERMFEIDNDLVEISSHVGARELCEPYQGKIFSLSGRSNKYPSLDSTSYGLPAGLFGINCGHNMYPYFEGTKKTFKPVPVAENKETAELQKKQRQIERNIRAAKKELELVSITGTTEQINAAKKKVSNQQSKMRSFIDETKLTRRRDREQIY